MKRPIEAGVWIGVDLDGTLAIWLGWSVGIGGPVPRMVARALAEQIALVQAWSQEYLGVVLPITCEKDWKMYELWDDRCRQVIENEGLFIDRKSTRLNSSHLVISYAV